MSYKDNKIRSALTERADKGFVSSGPIYVGKVDPAIVEHAKSMGNSLKSKAMYLRGKEIKHATRTAKQLAGISVSQDDLSQFPQDKIRMEIYYDTLTGNYTYTDRINKYVFKPNKSIRIRKQQKQAMSLVTASKLREGGYTEFRMKKYIKIK